MPSQPVRTMLTQLLHNDITPASKPVTTATLQRTIQRSWHMNLDRVSSPSALKSLSELDPCFREAFLLPRKLGGA
jgi:hypothetical protein